MIKILSGWSNEGGSTTSWINLTNAFNKHNVDTIFYGPHKYHLDKCNSGSLNELNITPNDIIIAHFLKLPENQKPNCKKLIFSSHEHEIFPVTESNYKMYDAIHYVSEHQRKWHGVDHPSVIIPNIVDDLKESENPDNVFGIIGSIDKNKNVHLSLKRAITDGAKKILIYGVVTDQNYYANYILPCMRKYDFIKMCGFCNDKQKMYDSISRVYQDSKMETWGYIKAECKKTGTEFYGNDATNEIEIWNTEDILKKWIEVVS